ncbi:hypothetical protein AVEN_255356-1 [Araneus ventricosus]|uniref:Uncharacterized protein n=1 Tax=Araneus ventricosus TaxID=182803 RepID=A0A4Y2MYY9_ARAVE|nr:hypothetical protein AVEN_255356-1 [Araneus ventricosus]
MGRCGLVIMSRHEADGQNPIPLKDLSLNVTLRDKSPPAEAVRKLGGMSASSGTVLVIQPGLGITRWLSSTTQYIKSYKTQDREQQQHKTSTQKKKRERHHGKNPDGSSSATYHENEKAVNCNRYGFTFKMIPLNR